MEHGKMTRVALYLLYLLIAVGVGTQASLIGGDLVGAAAGGLSLLLLAQIHGALVFRRERARYEADLGELRRAGLELEMALEATRSKMEDMSKVFDARASAQNRKIVGELQLLESLMREQAGQVVSRPGAPKRGGEVRTGRFMARVFEGDSDDALLETVRASLEENRVDLLLQPIVMLPQRKLRFYEAYSRLRTADGRVIMPKQYMHIAGPAGLMSVIDNLFLFRCVQIVRRLTRRNRETAVFCNIAGETLTDGEFFPQFLEYIEQNRDLARHIVFEFSQRSLEDADAATEANLRALARLGFALSMDQVETLSCDFARLNDIGVRFLKLKAPTLIGGLRKIASPVTADDLKLYLSRQGIELIVEHVEGEKVVLQLLDYGIDYAQGYLFGEPRTVREEALRPAPAPVHSQAPAARVIPLRRAAG